MPNCSKILYLNNFNVGFLPSQITYRSNILHHHFYLPEVDIQVQNGQGVLGSLVPSILDIGLACLGSMAILDLYIYFRQVKMMMKNIAS